MFFSAPLYFGRLIHVVSFVVGVAAACASSNIARAQPRLDPDRFNQPILAGASRDSYPYSFIGPDGKFQGFAVEVLDAVGRVMEMNIVRVGAPGNEIQNRFIAGEFDLMQVYGHVREREAIADFTVPILELKGSLFVRSDDKRFDEVADLEGSEIVIVGKLSVGEIFIRDVLPGARVVYESSVEDGLRRVALGRSDAVFSSRLSALSIIERDQIKNIRPLGGPLDGYDVRHCFAVHKGDAALLARLNEGLAILHQTGEFDRIYRRWFGRFAPTVFTREQVVTYAASALALGCLAAIWGLLRQRSLRKRIAGQAEELAESEAILAEAQQIAHVGHWHFDIESRKVRCSAEALRILERDKTQGPPSYFRVITMIEESERAGAHRTLREALSAGSPCDMVLTLHPREGIRKFIHANTRSVRDADGKIVGLFGTIQDITRQKTTEEDLRTREQLLLALYDNVPSAMGVVEARNNTFRFISANPGTARLLGLPPTEPLGDRMLAQLPLPPSAIDFWTTWFRRGHDRTDITKTEQYFEGSRRHYAMTLVPLGAAPAEHRQLCFLVEDITERIQMDTEIAQGRKLRAVGELVGGIAHEFNNLLTPILLKTELLATEWREDPRLLEELRTITRAGQRGADLTKRLLAFGRRSEPRYEEVRMQALVQANFDLLRPTFDRRIRLESDVPERLSPLYLNPSDVHQIVLNLLLNARDTLTEKLDRARPDAYVARIRVEAAEFGANALEPTSWESGHQAVGWICLTVRDNGMGMPREVLERIFEPFYTTKEVGKGTGLGLATVWHLVTRLGGKINVTSTPGDGSVFNVWLPVFRGESAAVAAAIPSSQTDSRPCMRILLVEDDDLVAQTVSTALRRQKHHVTHFAHGTDAWAHISAHPNAYDLTVLDLDLPGLSGLEIVRRVRSGRFTGKILVASGRLADAELDELKRLKVDGILEKPFTPQTLHLAVQGSINGDIAASAGRFAHRN